MICGMQTTVLSFVSLNLITIEYTLTRYQHLCSRLSGCQISSSLSDEDKTMENTNLFSSSHGLNTANCATTAKSNNNRKVLCIWFFFKLTATHITTGAGRRPSRPRCCEHRPTQASHSAGGCTTIWRGQAWLRLLRVSRPRTANRRRRSGTRRVPRPWRGQGTGHGTGELHRRCHVRLAATARASHCNIVARPGQAATGGQAPTARRRAPSALRGSGSGRQTPTTVATRGRRRDPAEAAAATRAATTTQAGVP
jgi:hypothetical protein